MKPVEIKIKLNEDMVRIRKLFNEKGKKVFFAYGLNGYLSIYEYDCTNFWKNGDYLTVYREGMII